MKKIYTKHIDKFSLCEQHTTLGGTKMKIIIFPLITVMAILLGIICPIGADVFAETESETEGNFIGTEITSHQTIDDNRRRLSNFVIDDVNFDGIVDNNDVTVMKKLVLSGQENVHALAKLKMDILHADEYFPKQVTSIKLKKFDVNLFNVTYLAELCRKCSYAELINDVLYISVYGNLYTINIEDTLINDNIENEQENLNNYYAKYYKIAQITTETPKYVVSFWYGGIVTEEPTYRVSVRLVDGKI